jgi:magnesium transporter
MPLPQQAENTELLEQALAALAEEAPERIDALLAGLHAAQVADLLESLPPEARTQLWERIAPGAKGDVLIEAHGEVRRQLIDESGPEELVEAVRRLDLDALSDIYDELPAGVVEAALRAMDAQRRSRFQTVRRYPDDVAGGLMDVDALTVRPDVNLHLVLDYLRRYRLELGRLPAHTDAVMVVGLDDRYVGRLPLADLASLPLERKVQEVMDREAAAIPADTPAGRVARTFEDRDLVSAAVVDEDGRVIGRITVDDVVDVIREEAEHSVLAGAGLDEEVDTFAPALESVRYRALWLGVHLLGVLVGAWVISHFAAAIDQLVALAVLMPVVASMGGVAGTQSLALVIRGLALEQVREGNRWRLLKKELAVGALNGLTWALAVGLIGSLWFDNAKLGAVFGVALIANLLAGVALGTVVPLALHRLRIDPALAGGVILIAFTDAFGFFVFLGLGALLLV